MLLRLLRRKTSLEVETPHELMNVEFKTAEDKYDFSLSVFELNEVATNVLRTKAEFTAGNDLDPTHRSSIDVRGAASWIVENTPTANKLMNFEFSSDAHRELKLDSEAKLVTLATCLLEDKDNRLRHVAKGDIRCYGYDRLMESDAEWVEVCKLSTRVNSWVMKGENSDGR